MIALIKFNNDLFLDKKEAEELKLSYVEVKEVGYPIGGYGERLSEKQKSDYWIDEIYYDQNEDKYYKDETKGKSISTYNIYKRTSTKDWVKVEQSGNLVDLDDFAPVCKYPYTIEKCVKNITPSIEGFHGILKKIEEKYEGLNSVLENITKRQFNERCDVHVGGGLIVTYNELMLKEDCCTDELQQELNRGWRIISACVQPDQRRPDYILGRYNSESELKDRAYR